MIKKITPYVLIGLCILAGFVALYFFLPSYDTLLQENYNKGIAQRDAGIKVAAEAAYGIGYLSETKLDLAKARDYYQRSLELDPNYQKAREALDKLEAKPK